MSKSFISYLRMFALFLFVFAAVPFAAVRAQDAGSTEDFSVNSRFFPPDDCIPGQLNFIAWYGRGTPTRCLQIPVCTGQGNHLQFDGNNFVCSGNIVPGNQCDPNAVSWQDDNARYTCHGSIDVAGSNGQTVRVRDGDPRFEGHATFRCFVPTHHEGNDAMQRGVWQQVGAGHCRPVRRPAQDCQAQEVQWVVDGYTCNSRVPAGRAGETVAVHQSPAPQNPVIGSARFTCVSFQDCPEGMYCPAVMPYWQLNEGATCTGVEFTQ